MTKLELIKLIGDLIVKIDEVILSGKGLQDPERPGWEKSRKRLNDAQRELGKLVFREDDSRYVEYTDELNKVNKSLKQELASLEELKKALGQVEQVLGLLVQIIKLFGGVASGL
ncbi:MAG: hypothetical protein ABSG91_16515 [Syntrophobacteraceae bacterium]